MKKYKDEAYLIIFDTIQIVRGYTKSMIYDIERNKSISIPITLYDFCRKNNKKTIKKIKAYYGSGQTDIVFEYIDFLIKNEFAFLGTYHDLTHFKPLDWGWDSPSTITNVIIEHSIGNFNNILYIIDQLNNLNIEALDYINFNSSLNLSDLEYLVKIFTRLRNLRYLKFQIKFDKWFTTVEKMETLMKNYPFIQTLYIFSSPFLYQGNKDNDLLFIQQPLKKQSCGLVQPEYFMLNLSFFTESQEYNTCLNRKLCIDNEGNIKNCPAMKQSFGNIKDITLQEAISQPGFTDLWFINKDQIDVCKDCEFRRMCMDCRCFIKDPGNIYSQPAKCTYNPYICKWEGEDHYVPVEKCGSYSLKTGFVPNQQKIQAWNKQIWREDK